MLFLLALAAVPTHTPVATFEVWTKETSLIFAVTCGGGALILMLVILVSWGLNVRDNNRRRDVALVTRE